MNEPGSEDTFLDVSAVDLYYGRIQALRQASLRVPKGCIAAILGPNGAGKSSLLNAVSGFNSITAGKIVYDGQDVTRIGMWKRALMGLCLVPEGRGLFRELTVMENLVLNPSLPDRDSCLEEAFSLFPVLSTRRTQRAGTLSGGEQQMLVLARAFLGRPRLLLIDEMSMGLAPQVVRQLFEAVRRIRDAGTTVLIVEQYIKEALRIADRVHIMRKGEIVLSADSRDIRDVESVRSEYFAGTGGEAEKSGTPAGGASMRAGLCTDALRIWRNATGRG